MMNRSDKMMGEICCCCEGKKIVLFREGLYFGLRVRKERLCVMLRKQAAADQVDRIPPHSIRTLAFCRALAASRRFGSPAARRASEVLYFLFCIVMPNIVTL